MKILITGDLVVNQFYDVSKIDHGALELFKNSDLNIVNLEAPVTTSTSKIKKTGPHLKADKVTTSQVFKSLNIGIVTLANNHVLDYDEKGVIDTMNFCKEKKIQYVGAGKNLKEASKTLFIDTKEGQIAIVNFAENEWSSATKEKAGANPMDFIDNVKQINDAKKKADFVFVIVHGGNEYNPYPSPRMVKQYRFYAEYGADVVIGHHTHCIGGYEEHKGVPIFYSLGNFLFTMQKEVPKAWYSGLVVSIEIKKNEKIKFEVIPVFQTKEDYSLSVASEDDKERIMGMIREINKVIADEELLIREWIDFVKEKQATFIRKISPIGGIKNKYIREALYRLKFHKLFMHKLYLKEALNRVRCEAHLDVTKEIFKQHLK